MFDMDNGGGTTITLPSKLGRARSYSLQENPGLERELVRALLAHEALIALTGDDRPARADLLDRAASLLTKNLCRIVRVESPDGKPLDLQRVMDQVVGFGQNGADRVERFFDTIALPVAQERHIVLILDDADWLTTDILSYLSLIGPTTVGQDVRLQIVFAGTDAMWDRLPRFGNLASERITARFRMEAALPLPVVSLRPPPTEGHAILRQRLAHRQRRWQRPQRFTSRFVGEIASAIVLSVIVVATVVLWVRMPELRAAVRGFVASKLVVNTSESQTVAALIASGNRLLGSGDVMSAQLVFAHAALAGSGPGATGLAKTYDPAFLSEIGARGISPDTTIATAWYQRAAALGDREAAERLSRMQAIVDK